MDKISANGFFYSMALLLAPYLAWSLGSREASR
jgi:hypothetical protein